MKRALVALCVFAALLAAAAGTFAYSKSPTHQLFGTIVPRVETDRKVVALTFDDGPVAEQEAEMVAALGGTTLGGTRATFFLIGAQIEESPAVALRLIARGFEIGNHSFHHDRMVFKSQRRIAEEIESTDALIRAAGWGTRPIFFRAPFGKKLIGLPWYLARHGRTHVTWDVEFHNERGLQQEIARVVASVRPGSIILMHPWYANGKTRAAIPQIIAALRGRGYDFVTVSELLALRRS
jgi:peptidoglycan/xylan/chitin deacetylase (PgdA/CDA1 family)